MSVSNGQVANAATFNAAFLSRTQDTDTIGRLKTAKYFVDGVADAVTAFAGGGQSSATALTKGISRITTCASDGDSVKLPISEAGQKMLVVNASSRILAVYPSTGAQISGLAANAPVYLEAGKEMVLYSRGLLLWDTQGFVSVGGQQSFTIANNQLAAASITGLRVNKNYQTSVRIFAEIRRTTGSNEVVANGWITLVWRALTSTWDFTEFWEGDTSGVTFSVTTTTGVAQVQYTSDNLAGTGYAGTLKWNALPVAA